MDTTRYGEQPRSSKQMKDELRGDERQFAQLVDYDNSHTTTDINLKRVNTIRTPPGVLWEEGTTTIRICNLGRPAERPR